MLLNAITSLSHCSVHSFVDPRMAGGHGVGGLARHGWMGLCGDSVHLLVLATVNLLDDVVTKGLVHRLAGSVGGAARHSGGWPFCSPRSRMWAILLLAGLGGGTPRWGVSLIISFVVFIVQSSAARLFTIAATFAASGNSA